MTRLPASQAVGEQPIRTRFDTLMAVLSLWWVAGLFLDGRAHLSGGQQTFFTLEHGVLYAVFPALITAFYLLLEDKRSPAKPWLDLVPDGYRLSLVGTVVFGVAGVIDLLWHQTAPVEGSMWGLLSFPHVLLVGSGMLIVSGPLLAARRRTESDLGARVLDLPMILSAAALFSVLSFITMAINPFVSPLAAAEGTQLKAFAVSVFLSTYHLTQEVGVIMILIQTVIVMGLTLALVRRFSLPVGAFSILFGLNAAAMGLLVDGLTFLPVLLVAGIATDGVYLWHRTTGTESQTFRLFAFVVPVVIYSLYFITISLTSNLVWPTPVWVGTVVLTGVTGFIVSYVICPPRLGRRLTDAINASMVSDGRTIGRPNGKTESNHPCPPNTPDNSEQRHPGPEPTTNVDQFSSTEAVDIYSERAHEGLFTQERKIISQYFTTPGAKVLDVGCGSGRATQPLAEKGFDMVGVDLSSPLIEEARAQFPHLQFEVGDATQLGYKDETFDYVVFTNVGLDYIYPEAQRRQALREIYRVLKPGGIFAFSSHNSWYFLPSVVVDHDTLWNLYLRPELLFNPFDRYTTTNVQVGETRVYLSSPVKQRVQLAQCGFDLLEVVGKRETFLKYFEMAPHYVARKPPRNNRNSPSA